MGVDKLQKYLEDSRKEISDAIQLTPRERAIYTEGFFKGMDAGLKLVKGEFKD